MKAEIKVFLLCALLGLGTWTLNGIIDVFLFQPQAWGVLFWQHLLSHLYLHSYILFLYLLAGAIIAYVMRERRLAQEALRESQRRYRELFDRAPQGIWEIGLDFSVRNVNQAFCELVGKPAQEIIGRMCFEILPHSACHTEHCHVRRAKAGQALEIMEVLVRRADGQTALCLLDSHPLSSPTGQLDSVLQLLFDVTEQRRLETRFRMLVETMGDTLTIVDPSGIIIYANPASRELIGYAPEELIGRPASFLMYDEENLALLACQLQRRAGGAKDNYEIIFRHKNGCPINVWVSAVPLYDENGNFAGSFAVLKDITKLKQTTERLEHLNSVLRAIRNVNQLITHERDRERLLARSCELLVETRGYSAAALVLTADSPTFAELASYQAGEPQILSSFAHPETLAELWDLVRQPPQMRAVLVPVSEAANKLASVTKALCQMGQSCMAVRLEYGGKSYGMLIVSLPAKMADSVEEKSLFEEVAGDIAFALFALEVEQERARYQMQLAEEHERSLRILQTAGALIVCLDPQGHITFFNRCCEEVTGFKAEEVLGRLLWEVLIPPRFVAQIQGVFEDLLQRTESNVYENPWLTKDGRERLISWRNARILDNEGQIREIVAIGLDITEHRAAEQAVHASEKRYRLLFNSGQDAIFVFELFSDGSVGRFLEVNDMACVKLGYSRQELLEKTLEELCVAEANGQQLQKHLQRLLIELPVERHVLFELEMAARDGRIVPMEISAHRFEFEGRPAVLAVARDVTMRRKAQQELERLHRQYEMLAESRLVGTFIVRGDRIIFANQRLHQMLGYSANELLGCRVLRLFPAEQREIALNWFREQQSSQAPMTEPLEMPMLTRKGELRWMQIWAQIMPSTEARPHIMGHIVDVTEARRLRAQLEHAQRLEALGRLAGGVAHEFNNILQAISMYAELIQAETEAQEAIQRQIAVILDRANYGKRLTSQLLTFSRPKPADMHTLLSINEVLREIQELLEQTLPRHIQIILALQAGLWLIRGDAEDLKQVFINLALNARDAMPQGGCLQFVTENVILAEEQIGQYPSLKPGPHVCVRVSDTGVGMDEETLQRIFEPFFTTKQSGKGTGLGLSVVHGIIEAHQGYIKADSRPGQGTTFEMYFPACPQAQTAEAEPPAEKKIEELPRGQHERVLIVDDEAEILHSTAEILRQYGYDVLAAHSGEEALRLYQEFGENIALVLLDLFMPGLSGQETLAQLRQINPAVKVIIASGYILPADKEANSLKAAGYLEKPFTRAELLHLIRQALQAPSVRL